MMIEVTKEEFDKRIRESLKINRCANCETYSGEIVVVNPSFIGNRGVCVICLGCGNKTNLYSDTDCFVDDSRLATPVTAESLARAIFTAVEEWNGNKRTCKNNGVIS